MSGGFNKNSVNFVLAMAFIVVVVGASTYGLIFLRNKIVKSEELKNTKERVLENSAEIIFDSKISNLYPMRELKLILTEKNKKLVLKEKSKYEEREISLSEVLDFTSEYIKSKDIKAEIILGGEREIFIKIYGNSEEINMPAALKAFYAVNLENDEIKLIYKIFYTDRINGKLQEALSISAESAGSKTEFIFYCGKILFENEKDISLQNCEESAVKNFSEKEYKENFSGNAVFTTNAAVYYNENEEEIFPEKFILERVKIEFSNNKIYIISGNNREILNP